ncbi:MAG: sulfotransferase [Acidobacteriota bacterium]
MSSSPAAPPSSPSASDFDPAACAQEQGLDPLPFAPLVILGAARSGTNVLRDCLTALPGFSTWPCDEINPVWRHGNLDVDHDELTAEHARPAVVRFLRRTFRRRGVHDGARVLVEKTCANTLRVAFVDRAFPDARYVLIERDGRDAVASAMKRWKAPTELAYTLRKARFVPWTDLPRLGWRWLKNRLSRRGSADGRLASWGPRFIGIQDAVTSRSLAEVCALQWRRCVENSHRDLALIAPERVLRLRYEEFVADPAGQLGAVARFAAGEVPESAVSTAAQRVRGDRVGHGRGLAEEDQGAVSEILRPVLEDLGYLQPGEADSEGAGE